MIVEQGFQCENTLIEQRRTKVVGKGGIAVENYGTVHCIGQGAEIVQADVSRKDDRAVAENVAVVRHYGLDCDIAIAFHLEINGQRLTDGND